ncbi:MAG TPA: hypothetical protein VII06_35060 [Chloroflexota bacterium]
MSRAPSTDRAAIVADYVATRLASRSPGEPRLLAPDPAWDGLAKRLGERVERLLAELEIGPAS